MTRLESLLLTQAPKATVLIRLMVGLVFLSEGVQKFLLPATRGEGRFIKIGLPFPELLGPIVGSVEIICGLLVCLGLLTRIAAVPLIIVMLVAITSTKIHVLLEEGFWSMAHEARTDWSMLLGSLYLLMVGPGPWSLDAWLVRETGPKP